MKKVGEWATLIVIVTAKLILQPFRHFTDVTTHSPTLPSLYLRHSSFSNPSVASPTSQFILKPFFRFFYVTRSSLNSPGEPPMGGNSVASLTLGNLYREKAPVFILQDTEWTPGPVWTRRSDKNSHPSATRDRTRVVQPVAKHLAPWAIWATMNCVNDSLLQVTKTRNQYTEITNVYWFDYVPKINKSPLWSSSIYRFQGPSQ